MPYLTNNHSSNKCEGIPLHFIQNALWLVQRTSAQPATKAYASRRSPDNKTSSTERTVASTPYSARTAFPIVPRTTSTTTQPQMNASFAMNLAEHVFWGTVAVAWAVLRDSISLELVKECLKVLAWPRLLQMDPLPSSTSQIVKYFLTMASYIHKEMDLKPIHSSISEMPLSKLMKWLLPSLTTTSRLCSPQGLTTSSSRLMATTTPTSLIKTKQIETTTC